jgi:hypothetical protein
MTANLPRKTKWILVVVILISAMTTAILIGACLPAWMLVVLGSVALALLYIIARLCALVVVSHRSTCRDQITAILGPPRCLAPASIVLKAEHLPPTTGEGKLRLGAASSSMLSLDHRGKGKFRFGTHHFFRLRTQDFVHVCFTFKSGARADIRRLTRWANSGRLTSLRQ